MTNRNIIDEQKFHRNKQLISECHITMVNFMLLCTRLFIVRLHGTLLFDLPRFLPRVLPRFLPRFLPRVLPRVLPRFLPRVPYMDISNFSTIAIERHYCLYLSFSMSPFTTSLPVKYIRYIIFIDFFSFRKLFRILSSLQVGFLLLIM